DRAALDVAVVRLCERSDATNDVAAAVAALLVRAGDAPTLILCERADEATDAEALRAGAAGLFPLHCGSEMLAAAVQLVAAGGTFYAPQRRDNGVVHARR
ncbi:MAG: hypothetical protein KGQ28_03830, partial [Hyphomicrobiales bacterium]|nr:hypothetical protein [Hyphomicrobiales bacterium]